MDFRQIVTLAVQVSIVSMVFGFGLKTRSRDLLYMIQRPGLLARCLLAVFVCMPIVGVALARVFEFRPEVEVALLALSISPLPPLLPTRETKGGGDTRFGIALIATLAVLSIVLVPAAVEVLGRIFGRPLAMAPGTVARVMLVSVLAPLAVGVLVHELWPALASRLERPAALVGHALLALAIVPLLVATLPAVWALIGEGTLVAFIAFTAIALLIGHVLGGPHPEESVVLALSTACRHPMLALAIASANFPGQRFVAALVLYLLVNVVVSIPYLVWQREFRPTDAHA